MTSWLSPFLKPWTWKMAWRDSRASRARLLLFSTSVTLGIAALTSIASFAQNLRQGIEEQAKSLLGADLILTSRQPFPPEAEALFQTLGEAQSRQINFSSMIYFPQSQETRLVQVRGLSGDFPFYGQLETIPASAAVDFRQARGALVEQSLLIQYNAKVGDPIRIGQLNTRIIGSLQKVPGETVLFATLAPRVYLAMAELDKTELLREGSLASYRAGFKLAPQTDPQKLLDAIRPQLDLLRLRVITVADRKKDLGRSMNRLYDFLNLVGFIALLLGGMGVATAIHVHVKQKSPTVATLRCLGATVPQAFAVYLLQGMALGFLGALFGIVLGLLAQQLLPMALADFLPLQTSLQISWTILGSIAALGLAFALLFALLPLLAVRRIPPLAALRAAAGLNPPQRQDPAVWIVRALIAAGILLFSLTHTHRWHQGLAFVAGTGAAFALLGVLAKGLSAALRKFTPPTLPYTWRQGLANLHRPNNRTVTLTLAIGLGTFMILTLYLSQHTLLHQLTSTQADHQANTVLFDIQSDQADQVANLIQSQHLTLLDQAPVVTMRLSSIKNQPVDQLLTNKSRTTPSWVLRREYRSTYNDQLRSGEKLIAGEWIPSVPPDLSPVPVSLEEDIASDLGVGLNDTLVFDVQGVPIVTRVASLRQVDWRRVQPNFFVVFPRGILEAAPAFHIMVTKTASPEQSANLQRAVVQQFPNVSTIDLTLILNTLQTILDKISFVVRFMAGFTVLTGLLVLAGGILTGRYQRIRESVLLRTLGASSSQVLKILLVEYLCLGALASAAGILLSLIASWALARFLFDLPFDPPLLPLALASTVICLLTIGTGLLASRGVLNQPPLLILRAEE